jgi:DNA polymerase-3 subunit beta
MSNKIDGLAFTTEAEILRKVLTRMDGVCERRNTIPILSHALLTVAAGRLTVTATDLEMALIEGVPVIQATDGSVSVSSSTLRKIASTLPASGTVRITQKGENVTVACGDFEAELVGLGASEFPEFKAGAMSHEFTMPSPVLKRLLDRVKHAIGTDACRFYLNGIYLHQTAEGEFKAVATDGHRLAVAIAPRIVGIEAFQGVIIPRKTIGVLLKFLAGAASDVTISTDTLNRVKFALGPITLITKPIDATYPDYERVIPKGNERKLMVNKKAFLSALASVDAVRHSNLCNAIKMSLAPGAVIISSHVFENGSAKFALNGATAYAGPPMEVGIQARYLRSALALAGDEVTFWFADGSAPVLVKSDQTDEVVSVLMPMRI